MALPPAPPASRPLPLSTGPYPASGASGVPASLPPGAFGTATGGFSVLPATIGAPVPAASRALRVEPEDCIDSLHLGSAAHSPSPRRMSPPAPRSRGVYMQKVGDPNQFKAVGAERASRLGLGTRESAGTGRRGSVDSSAALEKRASAFLSDALPLPAVQAAMDSEVAKLFRSGSEADREIFGLTVAAERSRLLARVLSALMQGSIFSLSLLSALIAGDGNELLEAYLRSLLLAASEFCLVVNILQALQGYERALSGQRGRNVEADEEDRDLRRRAWPTVANAAVAAGANAAVLLCCLLGEAAFAGDAAARGIVRGVQAGFGLVAIWPVLLDLRQLVSPWLPVPALIRLLGSYPLAGEDRRRTRPPAASPTAAR